MFLVSIKLIGYHEDIEIRITSYPLRLRVTYVCTQDKLQTCQTIFQVILDYPNLKVLYLHANYIDDIKQIHKLASLPQLKALTLHGNMIEEKKGYRYTLRSN